VLRHQRAYHCVGRDELVRIALLSDIHANRGALDACMRHACERGADRFAFLGDFVGYGADAVDVVERIADEVARGAIAVKGNHDEAIERRVGYFNDAATAALDWARATLGAAQRTFLAQLPLCVRDAPLCLVHASAANPQRYDYVDSPTAAHRCAVAAAQPFTFVGHVHDQALYYEGTSGRMLPFRPVAGTAIPVGPHRRWVAIVGSVGQPRDRNPAAAYALFDTAQSELTFFRVPYDHHAAAERIRQAGLPEALAYRVEMGI
jgi:diadenosine tetraphosphatase ApaH/serine/threonine PP2A family protein phosphatase